MTSWDIPRDVPKMFGDIPRVLDVPKVRDIRLGNHAINPFSWFSMANLV